MKQGVILAIISSFTFSIMSIKGGGLIVMLSIILSKQKKETEPLPKPV